MAGSIRTRTWKRWRINPATVAGTFRVDRRLADLNVADVGVAEVGLNGARVDAVVAEPIATGMPQLVRVAVSSSRIRVC